MSQPLVSILVPFKNSALYLEECLNSILQQTYKNWELLIVNDHSTDKSNDIVEAFALRDSRIKLFQNNGIGIIEALRLAYSVSAGNFITRMDSDDLMATNKIEVLVSQLLYNGRSHISLGLVNYFCEGKLGQGFYNYEKWLNNLTRHGTNFTEIYKECVIPSPCWMVYREDLDNCGAFSYNTYPEDYDLAFRFYRQQLKCIPSQFVLHHWRDYSWRTSRTHSHYKHNHFLKLKTAYFLELDYNSTQPLFLWGAGMKGKLCASLLRKRKISFLWICNNPNKIGKFIYQTELKSIQTLNDFKQPQVIVTVANKNSQKKIEHILEQKNLNKASDYFFFC